MHERTEKEVEHVHPDGARPHEHSGQAGMSTREESVDTVQLREEELRVRKNEVEAGRVRVETDVVAEQRSIDVPVRREEVVVERHAVDRRPADLPVGADAERAVEVALHEERVDVEKRAVVYEEVSVGKQAVTDTQRVSDSVRREVADVRTEGDPDTHAHRQ